jgi:hypothetical protein
MTLTLPDRRGLLKASCAPTVGWEPRAAAVSSYADAQAPGNGAF